ncbi:putative adenylate cyclase [Tenacibaculum maritimum]|uniref:CYTH domain-containing protein n=1 Tax=Tenacibaculum maritimum TaxID=107401 RepID=UPI0012E6697B|nr:CYTH domain-containing protein [Tenacibaculum maritimum]CAA0157337.1 putative adenylate cyclase [Tenacibaculum maritimum]CAA0177929.1 putative adenylate cyclase [Tenacibaculum maritimum]CAA0194400.1 putative adenylate cyclase [Tenacibaculum maritimum]
MAVEIERKFLVTSNHFKKESFQKKYIKQGFLNSNKERVVRVRINDNKGFLTIKGASNKTGTTRFEWEKEIDLQEANDLLDLCEKGIIEKYRYLVPSAPHLFEVDEFVGDNAGLIIAEIELQHESENFKKPEWLGKEVTGKKEYYNSNLSKFPFNKWH